MFTVSRDQLTSIASVGHCASVDDVTPVLTHVHLMGDKNAQTITATATDRYKAAEIVLHGVEIAEDFNILVPAKWFLNAAKSVKGPAQSGFMPTAITLEKDLINITNYDVTVEARLGVGNFPPIARLLPENPPAFIDNFPGWSLNPAHIADIAKVIPPTATLRDLKNKSLLFSPSDKMRDTGKSAAVVVTRPGFDGFRALLQPNLHLN